jgi:hypothetical protein
MVMDGLGLLERADRALNASYDAYALVTMLFFPRRVEWASGLDNDTLGRLVPLFDRSFVRLSQLRDDLG